jgi:cation-transporting ATPase 13A3/4/5
LSETFGENKLDIGEKSIFTLLIDEVLSPFNIFQIFALSLWMYDSYMFYALLILFLTII